MHGRAADRRAGGDATPDQLFIQLRKIFVSQTIAQQPVTRFFKRRLVRGAGGASMMAAQYVDERGVAALGKVEITGFKRGTSVCFHQRHVASNPLEVKLQRWTPVRAQSIGGP